MLGVDATITGTDPGTGEPIVVVGGEYCCGAAVGVAARVGGRVAAGGFVACS
jgi:hypothetical protein